MNNKNKYLLTILRVIPIIIIISVSLYMISTKQEISVEKLLNYTPQNTILAIAFILILYAFKSLSFVFPLIAIQIACGTIFNVYLAIIINIVGIIISLSIPYFMGRYYGSDFAQKLVSKHKKLEVLDNFQKDNNFFFSFIARIIGILPIDVVSMYMGSVKLNYFQYITGGVLGFLPRIIATTVMGSTITDVSSPAFIISTSFNIVIATTCILVYKLKLKHK